MHPCKFPGLDKPGTREASPTVQGQEPPDILSVQCLQVGDIQPCCVAAMAKGLLTALGVMLVCTIIPVAQFLLAPFGPFLGAYFGIRSVDTDGATPLVAAAKFGVVVGAASGIILVVIAVVLMLALPMEGRFVALMWIAVAVFATYVAGMSTLGGLYRLMKMRTAAVPAEAS